jgi:hypothetical protein
MQRFDGEEIAREHLLSIVVQKRPPRIPTALGRGQEPMPAQDVLNGRWIDDEAKLQQLTLYFIVPHAQVLTRDPENQRLDIRVKLWASSTVRVLKRPLPADELSVPLQYSFGLNQQNCFAHTLLPALCLYLQTFHKGNEHQLFGTRKTWFRFRFALQHAELLTEQGKLQVFIVGR